MNSTDNSRKTIVINDGAINQDGTINHSSSSRRANNHAQNRTRKISQQSRDISKTVLEKIRKKCSETARQSAEMQDTLYQQPLLSPLSIATVTPPPAEDPEENRDLIQSIQFLEELTKNVQEQKTKQPPPQAHLHSYYSQTPHYTHTQPIPPGVSPHRHITPGYGCLKGGVLPTFRTTVKCRPPATHYPIAYHGGGATTPVVIPTQHPVYTSQQLLQPIQHLNHTSILTENPPLTELDKQIQDLSERQQFMAISPSPNETVLHPSSSAENLPETALDVLQPHSGGAIHVPTTPNYQKRIIRRTHRVGRSKKQPIVSVLLPNKTIRSKVATHSKTMKTLPMSHIKNTLVKRGMIKVGSDAPENVLREIYENMCLIGGPVMNYNPDTLYYNMIHQT